MEENIVGIIIALARDDIKIIFYLLFNSALAYCVNLTNFLVTKHTNALTLQVEKEIEERRKISFHKVGISVAPPVSFQDIVASHGDSEEDIVGCQLLTEAVKKVQIQRGWLKWVIFHPCSMDWRSHFRSRTGGILGIVANVNLQNQW